ncbi:MAG: alpha/beta hydrolase [Bacteroidetes bacterium]|nr:alpha/beta hydrolase [Bacteroidota bacterium]
MKKICTAFFIFTSGFIISQNQPNVEMIREAIAGEIKSLNIAPEKIYKIENRTIEGIAIRIYYPSSKKKLPIIYNIHGGALVAGDLETHDNISRKLSNAANSIVIALDYRKAPEHPFPKSLGDVYAIYKWIVSDSSGLNSAKVPMSIVSDSGGSLLAAALQIQIKQKKDKGNINKVIYINPAFDLRNPEDDIYALVTTWYLSGADPNNELASPILTKDFSVFAPALIVVNEKDILLNQGTAFSTKLNLAGVKNELFTVQSEDHFGGYWAAGHQKTKSAFDKTVKFLTKD